MKEKKKITIKESKKNPDVSIIVPVYNSKEMAERLLKALRIQKTQHTYEVIIVDDGSTESFGEITKQYNVKYIRCSVNMGPANARNIGAETAKGKILCFIDADCIPCEKWLDELLAPLFDEKIGVVGGSVRPISKSISSLADDLSMFLGVSKDSPSGYRDFLPTLNFAIRKEVFNKVEGFDPTLRTSEDLDLCIRVRKKGYKIFFQPSAEVIHDPNRKSFREFIKRHYRAGNLGGGLTRIKYKKEVKLFKFFPTNSFLIFIILPLYAFVAALRAVLTILKRKPLTILLFPIIYIGKIAWAFGAFGIIKKYNRRKRAKSFLFNNIEAIFLKKRYKLPLNLIFHVTFRCNSRCIHCFNWKNLNKSEEKELSIKEIERIAKSLSRINSFALSGGEPFLRDDVDKICEIFYTENSVRSMSIPTNGLLPEVIYEKTKNILDMCPKADITIALSLDGTEKMHDYIRGIKGNFQKLMETSKKLAKLKEKYPNLILKVNSTVFKKNIDNLLELAKFVITNMPEIDVHSFELMRGETKDSSLTLPSINELKEYSKKLEEIWDKYKPFRQSNIKSKITIKIKKYLLSLHIKTLEKKKQLIPCYAGKIYGVLYPFGEVSLCELLPPIGNVRKEGYDFFKVWHSQKAEEQRKNIKNKKCYCTHTCFQLANVMANPKLYPRILAK